MDKMPDIKRPLEVLETSKAEDLGQDSEDCTGQ